MFFLIFFASLAVASQLQYEAGNRYTYDFQSLSRIEATNVEGESKGNVFGMTSVAHFDCIFADESDFFFEMTVENVRITENLEDEAKVLGSSDENLAAHFRRPVFFTLTRNSDITNVRASEEDTDEIINIKVAMMELIRSPPKEQEASLEIDTQGMHFAHYESEVAEDGHDSQGYFTDGDFIHFRDEAAEKKRPACFGHHSHRRRKGITHSSTRRVTYSFTTTETNTANNEYEQDVFMTAEGFTTLDLRVVEMSNAPLLTKDAAKARANNLPFVSFFNEEYYAHRSIISDDEEDTAFYAPSCPSGINLCKSYGLTYWVGNQSCGVQLSGSLLAGTNSGCKQTTRNMLAGAYLNLDLWIMNNKYSMVEAFAEYGYIGGTAQRNGIQVNVFGYSLYKKSFPQLPCTLNSINILNTQKSFSASFTVYVSVLPVTFSVGTTLSLSVTAPYKICFTTWDASIGIKPVATVKLFADVTASILLAKGGIRLEASVTQTIDPTAYLSIGQCRIGIKASSITSPFTAKFLGYVQTRDCSDWCNWGKIYDYTFWKWQSNAITKQLFDYYYQV